MTPTDFIYFFIIRVYFLMIRVDPSPILFYFYFFIRSELVRVGLLYLPISLPFEQFTLSDNLSALATQHLAKHVMQVHLNAAQTGQAQEGELSLNFLKKYIGYCRK